MSTQCNPVHPCETQKHYQIVSKVVQYPVMRTRFECSQPSIAMGMRHAADKQHEDQAAVSHCLTAIVQRPDTTTDLPSYRKSGWQHGGCDTMFSLLLVSEGAALAGGGSLGGREAAAWNLRGAGHASRPTGAGLVLQGGPPGRLPARLLQHDRAGQQ